MTRSSYHDHMHRKHTPQTIGPAAGAHRPSSPQELAEAVAVDGFDAHAVEVAALVEESRRLAISDVLAAVSLDRHQPVVARERAFGRLVAAYCRALEREA